jgi:glycosyltransferase involved in cell wall biosynthesis
MGILRCELVNRMPRIALDFRWLDELSLCNGQYRYAVDLMRGLAASDSDMHFVVLGSRPHPVSELEGVFEDRDRWEYHWIPRFTGRGSIWHEQTRYAWLMRRLKLDVFHALHSFVPLFPSVPVVATVYDMMLEFFPEYASIVQSREYRLHKWAFSRFVKRAIAISRTTAADLARLWGYPGDRTDVVYLSTDLAACPDVQRSPTPVLLAPYNLEPRKNLITLLEAAAKLKNSGMEYRLVLFGRAAVNEERENEFQSHVRRLGIGSCIEFTGRVSDRELAGLYRSASVFVFPSLYEGFGLPVLEAMSAGRCVIAHDGSAMAEVLGDAGWRVDMRCPEALCGAISAAMNSPLMGLRAAERAKNFTRDRMARETVAVYTKVLSEALSRSHDLRYSERVYAGAGNRLLRSVAQHLESD